MPATLTLSTTTLLNTIGTTDSQVKVDSTSAIFPGYRLWIDRELMTVISLGISPWVNVQRGVDGTSSQPHNSTSPVYIGRAVDFYTSDPSGRPDNALFVSPWINAITGDMWMAQGDTAPNGQAFRYWQKMTTTYDIGNLGVRSSTTSPTEGA